jgi:hypothetical protein
MWLIIFMAGAVVPLIIFGYILSWRERQADRENEEAALHHTDTAPIT